MNGELWFSELESRLFTIFKTRMKAQFNNAKFTTNDQQIIERNFPVVYFHELEQVETGNDLDNTSVNAINETIQIQVYAKNADDCRNLSAASVSQMKSLRFNVIAMPIYTHTEDGRLFLSSMRFRRVYGGGDSLT